jgi:hypothetical protein
VSRWRSALQSFVMRDMMAWLKVGTLILLLFAPARTVHAQESVDPLAPALAAFNDLDYDVAATRFRAAIALIGAQRLPDADRARALMYLGATENFRGVRTGAVDAFRSLLIIDPRYRPSEVIFPPEVIALYQETRIGVRATSAEIAPNSEIAIPTDRLPIKIFASSLHDIRVRVTTSLGAPERILYEGVIGDSILVSWDGREASGAAGRPGRYLLRIASRGPGGNTEREVQIPLEVEHVPIDTLPWPEQLNASSLRPETIVRANGTKQVITGLAGAAAVVLLPSLIGATDPSSLRYGVAAGITVAGLVGLATATRPQPVPENIAFNNTLRAEWTQELERIRAENRTRLATVRLRVRVERAVTVEIR